MQSLDNFLWVALTTSYPVLAIHKAKLPENASKTWWIVLPFQLASMIIRRSLAALKKVDLLPAEACPLTLDDQSLTRLHGTWQAALRSSGGGNAIAVGLDRKRLLSFCKQDGVMTKGEYETDADFRERALEAEKAIFQLGNDVVMFSRIFRPTGARRLLASSTTVIFPDRVIAPPQGAPPRNEWRRNRRR